MALRFDSLAIDARDPEARAAWWQQVLGGEVVREQETVPRLLPPGGPAIDFLAADDQRVGKNRLHLDLRGPDRDTEVERLLALGATTADIGQGEDVHWRVLADPEGDVFCVLHGEAPAPTVAAIVFDAVDPRGQARWWQQVLGGELDEQEDGVVVCLDGARDAPHLDFIRVDDAKITKNRLHLDLSPDDQVAEVARLEALGATRVDIGQGEDVPWVVLADPEGNELCVLSPDQ